MFLSVPRKIFSEHRVLLVILACALICVMGCGGVNSTGDDSGSGGQFLADLEAGGMKGAILASGSVPVAAAIVEAGEHQTIAASDGRYLMLNLSAGDYRVVARAPGFQPGYREGVRVRPGIITEDVNFELSEATATASRDFEVVSLSPAFGTDRDRISVIGRGIGTARGRVTVAGKEAEIIDWNSGNNGVVEIRLPDEVETGEVKLIIGGEASHETRSVVFTAKPVAREVIPASSVPNGIVTLYGRNFHPVGSSNRVRLNGLDCTVLGYTTAGRDLRIQLPAKAETGILEVSINSPEYQFDGISSVTITIQPTLVHLSPRRCIPGKTLTLYGTNFVPDSGVTKIRIGDAKTVQGNEILSISKTKITFKAPSVDVVPAGQSVPIRVEINGYQTSPITWTSYDTTLTTLSVYGVYDFFNSPVANDGILHLASLEPGERLAFISVTAGDQNTPLDGSYSWTFTGLMGGQTGDIPQLPASRRDTRGSVLTMAQKGFVDIGPLIRSRADSGGRRASRRSLRASAFDTAPASTTFWMLDLNSADPMLPANDVLATGTLAATGTHCLVYLDASDSVLVASDAEIIAGWFDGIRSTLATACWDGLPLHQQYPEGNVDDQPRVVLFLTSQINQNNSSGLYTLGYYNPRDKNTAAEHSAGTEIIYLWDQAFKNNPSDFRGVLAHELQHMMYDHQKGVQGVTWLSEGLSVWAQQVTGFGFPQKMPTPVSQVAAYLGSPQTVSLNHWPEESGLGNYGLSYLFVQYLYERCGGYAAIQKLEQNNGVSGFTDINAYLRNNAVPATANIETLFNEFALALYCDDLGLSSSLPGFSAEAHRFRDIALRNGVSGVDGVKHLTYGEAPIDALALPMPGFAVDVVEYDGNTSTGGDIEVRVARPADVPGYKLWVIYYKK